MKEYKIVPYHVCGSGSVIGIGFCYYISGKFFMNMGIHKSKGSCLFLSSSTELYTPSSDSLYNV